MTGVVVLFGRPAVGKFTIGQQLADALDYRLLHNHAVVDLATSLFPFGSEPFIRLREELWLAAVDAAIDARLRGIVLTFVPERTVTDAFLPNLRRRVESRGACLRFVELQCAEHEIERRLSEPSRARFGKLRDAAQYRELDAAGVFSRPEMPAADVIVDVTQQDASTSARTIARQLSALSG